MKIRMPEMKYARIAILIMLAIVFGIVWNAGGTSSAWPHLFYLPIILAALVCTWQCSLAVALISGFLCSKWIMPLSKDPLILQTTTIWLIRLLTYITISLWTTLMFSLYKRQADYLQKQLAEFVQLHQASLHALVDLAEMYDEDVTGRHIGRLGHYAALLAEYLGLDKEQTSFIGETIKTHPIRGANLLKSIESEVEITNQSVSRYLQTAADIVLYHHERWDGTGYPAGLKGKSIPLSARIAAICDVYDSLRSKRPYKKEFSHEEAVRTIVSESGTHFDPDIVAAFQALAPEFARIFAELSPKNTAAQIPQDEIAAIY